MNDFDNEEQSMRTMRGDTNEGTIGRIDQYDIISKLGGGGFGVVYLVRDTQSDVDYAIKTLHPLLKSNPEEMENLRNQFSLVSKLNHSHIASAMYLHPVKEVVYANEEVRKELRLSAGDFVMVMKYAPGVTLSKWRKQFQDGIVPVEIAIDICKQIASALDYAHSEKIIHRDIKPENIMIETRENGSVFARVLDFGLAAEIRSSMSRVSTDKGDTSGTRPYMAPEQWMGKKQGPATDQYALAVLFYELVSGVVPFAGVFETGDFMIMLNSVKVEDPELLEGLSDAQNQILLKALSKSPKDRYDSCSIFLDIMLGKESVKPKVNMSSSNSNTKSIICKKCNYENEEDATFCVGCGSKIERDDICPKCGATLSENQMFCKKCGSKTPLCLTIEAEQKAREEAEQKAREEAEQKAREEAEHKAREEAERKAKEEAERKDITTDYSRKTHNVYEEQEKNKRRAIFRTNKVNFFVYLFLFIFGVLFYYHFSGTTSHNTNNDSVKLTNQIDKLISDMVQIPEKDYLMCKYEVTQAQWQEIMGNNPSSFTSDLSMPVESVSWDECQQYIKKLNSRPEVTQADIKFFLPTQEEWEYACRAGSTGSYGLKSDGKEGTLDEMGWYNDNSHDTTHPVGQKIPNAWGLYDMHGNVDEWTSSLDGKNRIYKGGSYYNNYYLCKSNFSYWCNPDSKYVYLGFRLAARYNNAKQIRVQEIVLTNPQMELHEVGDVVTSNKINVSGIEMVKIPDSAEHKGLYFGKYEVTQEQWKALMGYNPSKYKGNISRPVEQVSFNDCLEFINKLNATEDAKKNGFVFRLPTQKEWEYACRAGSTGSYGLLADGQEGSLEEMGWFGNNSDNVTHPVGQKKPNMWGLYDMHGNVWEWNCSNKDSQFTIHCGGGFTSNQFTCQSSNIGFDKPTHRDYRLGFRVVANFITLENIETEQNQKKSEQVKNNGMGVGFSPNTIVVAGYEIVRIPDSAEHKGLYFGKYEVTQAQWQAIMGNNPSFFKGDLSLPVEEVSWNDCQEFIKKLNARTEVKSAGIKFRLPTEQEWEYACRAGSTGKYGLLADGRAGSIDEMGWCRDNSGETQPVGKKTPNAWGLYDMHGNVWEWTASANGEDRIYRGGSYYNNAFYCEADYRNWSNLDRRDDGLGFRLVAVKATKVFSAEQKDVKFIQEKSKNEEITVAGIEMARIPDSAEHKGLYFGKYEVTQEQWQKIMGNNPSHFKGDLSCPIEKVSWNDCQEFISKLNARTEVKSAGIIFRLPTEEEWEYACRAGSTGKYGLLADGREGTIDEMGWYCDNSDDKTHPVGQKKPNAWGLYDMHGNVCEWTASASADGEARIRRGGCYGNYAFRCEAADWDWFSLDYRLNYLGFRLVAVKATKVFSAEQKDVKFIQEKSKNEEITVAGIEMVRIPDSAEHKGLYFGKYEVTQAKWKEIMGNNPSYFKGDLSCPVEKVSWNDCQDFISKLNARTEVKSAGIKFRLPTEQEWEYACRAGSTGKYGLLADGREGTIDEMGWYCDNSDNKTHPVGQKKPNAWGLYDMHGNVCEWTASADGSSRIRRGGSYFNLASGCESGFRFWSSPDIRRLNLGFRLVAFRTNN